MAWVHKDCEVKNGTITMTIPESKFLLDYNIEVVIYRG